MEDDDDDDDEVEESWSSDSRRNVLGRSVSGTSFSMETADRIVVVVVLSVRLRVWDLEELKESLVVGFDFGEVEVRGKRVK